MNSVRVAGGVLCRLLAGWPRFHSPLDSDNITADRIQHNGLSAPLLSCSVLLAELFSLPAVRSLYSPLLVAAHTAFAHKQHTQVSCCASLAALL